jgi:acetyl esterase/lipase
MKSKQIFLTPDQKAWLTALLFDTPFNTNALGSHELRPAIVVVPGGGYNYCSQRESSPVSLHFSLQGYQTFVLEYHCGEDSDYPSPLIDIALALAHIRAHAAEYDIDPNRIALLGFSAGGHLSALLGSLWHTPELSQLTHLEPPQFQPNALILGYPVANLKAFSDLMAARNDPENKFGSMLQSYTPAKDPMHLVNELIPPVFLFTTLEDDLILPEHTFTYAQRLLEAGISLEFHQFSEGGHGLGSADGLSNHGRSYPKRLGTWLELAVNWLNAVFKHEC